MTRIAFFGYDAADAAVRRRARGFRDDGLDVTGFMMRRQDGVTTDWDNVDLGRTYDGKYAQRIRAVLAGAGRAAAARAKLAQADILYARNLDMLATAFLAKKLTGLKTPVVYEALDVHRLLTMPGPVGFLFRRLEGALLRRSRLLVVSSPAFLRNHFEKRHRDSYVSALVENRLAAGGAYGARPSGEKSGEVAEQTPSSVPLTIGWVGNLRCSRSLDLLLGLAAAFGDRIRIRLQGAPALTEIPDFYERIAAHPNVAYHGRYRAPEDLAKVYAGLDLVWAGDFMEAGFNSAWLLPNRLYEGGYYAVPAIAPAEAEAGRWVESHGAGFTAKEDLATTLPELVGRLMADRGLIAERREALLALPDDVFVQPRGLLKQIIEEAIGPASHRPISDRRQPASDSAPAAPALRTVEVTG